MIYNGKHVMVDATLVASADKMKLNNPTLGREVLESIIEEIDMTMILPVITVQFPHNICEMKRILSSLNAEGLAESATALKISQDLEYRKLQSYGFSSIAMIAESHLSLHTFPEEGFYTFDCYSCKDFDDTKIKEILFNAFGECVMNYNSIPRLIPKL
jgi:S-adenosylmethionine decarboxylase